MNIEGQTCLLCGHRAMTGLHVMGCLLCFACEQRLLRTRAYRVEGSQRRNLLHLYRRGAREA